MERKTSETINKKTWWAW